MKPRSMDITFFEGGGGGVGLDHRKNVLVTLISSQPAFLNKMSLLKLNHHFMGILDSKRVKIWVGGGRR